MGPGDRVGTHGDSGGRTVPTNRGIRPATPARRESRLRDPAHRDQDGTQWHQGRFAERVRRQWNVIALHEEPVTAADLPILAEAIHQRVGGDVREIEARLAEFERMERGTAPPEADPLVKPGEPV